MGTGIATLRHYGQKHQDQHPRPEGTFTCHNSTTKQLRVPFEGGLLVFEAEEERDLPMVYKDQLATLSAYLRLGPFVAAGAIAEASTEVDDASMDHAECEKRAATAKSEHEAATIERERAEVQWQSDESNEDWRVYQAARDDQDRARLRQNRAETALATAAERYEQAQLAQDRAEAAKLLAEATELEENRAAQINAFVASLKQLSRDLSELYVVSEKHRQCARRVNEINQKFGGGKIVRTLWERADTEFNIGQRIRAEINAAPHRGQPGYLLRDLTVVMARNIQ